VYGHKFLEDVHEDSIRFLSQNRRFLCNRPNRPLKASGHPIVSRSFRRSSCPYDRATPSGRWVKLFRVRVEIGFHVQTRIGKQQPSGRKGNTIRTLFRFLGRFLHTSQCFYHNSLLEYRIETKLVSLES
jgi:hypothetical protein